MRDAAINVYFKEASFSGLRKPGEIVGTTKLAMIQVIRKPAFIEIPPRS
jgi:hypothetical protein